MYYEINIAKKNHKGNYVHFFATAERSITTTEHLKVVYNELIKAFPEPQYLLGVSENKKIGNFIDINTL